MRAPKPCKTNDAACPRLTMGTNRRGDRPTSHYTNHQENEHT